MLKHIMTIDHSEYNAAEGLGEGGGGGGGGYSRQCAADLNLEE